MRIILLLFIFPQRNSNTIYQLRQEISSLREKIEEYGKSQMKWEIVRELGGHSGGGKGDKPWIYIHTNIAVENIALVHYYKLTAKDMFSIAEFC